MVCPPSLSLLLPPCTRRHGKGRGREDKSAKRIFLREKKRKEEEKYGTMMGSGLKGKKTGESAFFFCIFFAVSFFLPNSRYGKWRQSIAPPQREHTPPSGQKKVTDAEKKKLFWGRWRVCCPLFLCECVLGSFSFFHVMPSHFLLFSSDLSDSRRRRRISRESSRRRRRGFRCVTLASWRGD